MTNIKSLIIYPMDPLGSKIGGIETFLKNFIKHSPDDFEIEFVGVSSNKKRPVGRWQEIKLYGRRFRFHPVLYVKDENIRTKIPLALKFTISLLRYKHRIPLENRILEFHRIEPSLPFRSTVNKKLLFVHGNIMDIYNPHAEVKWGKFPWFYFQMEKRLIGYFSKIFVVREDGVRFYKGRYSSLVDRFSFLPTWIDEETFYPYKNDERQKKKLEFIEKNGFSPQDKLILFVGRLEGQKNPMLLIETFFHVSKHLPESRLLVVGTGGLKKKILEEIKRYRINGRVNFFGVLPQVKVSELMRISDIFLLTSAFEGMPFSVLEALGSGLPVVSTNVGEIRKVVKNGFSGLISSEHRSDVIGNAVLEILNNKPRFNSGNCLMSIKEYKAKSVLQQVYQTHYNLVKQ